MATPERGTGSSSTPGQQRWLTALLAALVLGGIIQGLLLVRRATGGTEWIQAGAELDTLTARSGLGRSLTISFRDLPECSVVLFLSPSCATCEALAPRWATDFAPERRRNVIGISFSEWASADSFVRRHALSFSTYAVGTASSAVAARLGILAVPTTLILGRAGVVKHVLGPSSSVDSAEALAACPEPRRSY